MKVFTHITIHMLSLFPHLLGALSAFGVGYLHLNWELLGEGTLAIISLLDGALLVTMGLSYNIWVSYINYIIFRVSYQMLITIAR